MTFSMKRMYAIFQKDLKDLSKNMFVGSSIIMPIILAAIYGRMEEIPIEAHYLIINLAFIAVTFFMQCALIAEEKEKNTLRGLMLSPATLPEILGGKSLVSFILTIITVILCVKFTGYEPANLLLISIAIIVSSLFFLALGTLIGLFAKSVVEASVIMLPVMFVFGLGSMLMGLAENYPILAFIEYLPNVQLVDFANKVQTGSEISNVWLHLVIIFAWFVVTAILTVFVFKKREMDE